MSQGSPSRKQSSESGRLSLVDSRWFNTLGRFLALFAVFMFFAVMVEEGKFYTPRNLENILRQSSVYATAALGMTRGAEATPDEK